MAPPLAQHSIPNVVTVLSCLALLPVIKDCSAFFLCLSFPQPLHSRYQSKGEAIVQKIAGSGSAHCHLLVINALVIHFEEGCNAPIFKHHMLWLRGQRAAGRGRRSTGAGDCSRGQAKKSENVCFHAQQNKLKPCLVTSCYLCSKMYPFSNHKYLYIQHTDPLLTENAIDVYCSFHISLSKAF